MALIPVAIGLVSSMQQGNAQNAQAQAAATTARTNAGYANKAAADAITRGTYDADIQRIRTSQSIGTQRAAMAANGGQVNSGSNATIQEDTAQLGELDALTIQNNAAREAYGYKVQALSGYSNANALVQQGASAQRNSLLGGVIKGAGSLFGGGFFGGSGGVGAGTTAALSSNSGASSGLLSGQAFA